MPREEKRLLLRARATALRERALALVDAFTEPVMTDRVGAVLSELDDELVRLDRGTEQTPLPRLSQYLPTIAARIEALEMMLRTYGRHANPPSADPRARPSPSPRTEPPGTS